MRAKWAAKKKGGARPAGRWLCRAAGGRGRAGRPRSDRRRIGGGGGGRGRASAPAAGGRARARARGAPPSPVGALGLSARAAPETERRERGRECAPTRAPKRAPSNAENTCGSPSATVDALAEGRGRKRFFLGSPRALARFRAPAAGRARPRGDEVYPQRRVHKTQYTELKKLGFIRVLTYPLLRNALPKCGHHAFLRALAPARAFGSRRARARVRVRMRPTSRAGVRARAPARARACMCAGVRAGVCVREGGCERVSEMRGGERALRARVSERG